MKYLLIVLALLAVGCGAGSHTGAASSGGGVVVTELETETLPYAPAPPPPTTTTPIPASACPPANQLLNGVYHPSRLQVIDPCFTTGVTVKGFRHETDGDVHLYLTPDDSTFQFKPGAGGYFIAELMPRDAGHLPAPVIGAHWIITGAFNLDLDHGWDEIHPIFQVVTGGNTYVSGPQFGGSPSFDSSTTAAADCRDQNGKPCVGWPSIAGVARARTLHNQGVQPLGDSTD